MVGGPGKLMRQLSSSHLISNGKGKQLIMRIILTIFQSVLSWMLIALDIFAIEERGSQHSEA
jgi:hypothetical protein